MISVALPQKKELVMEEKSMFSPQESNPLAAHRTKTLLIDKFQTNILPVKEADCEESPVIKVSHHHSRLVRMNSLHLNLYSHDRSGVENKNSGNVPAHGEINVTPARRRVHGTKTLVGGNQFSIKLIGPAEESNERGLEPNKRYKIVHNFSRPVLKSQLSRCSLSSNSQIIEVEESPSQLMDSCVHSPNIKTTTEIQKEEKTPAIKKGIIVIRKDNLSQSAEKPSCNVTSTSQMKLNLNNNVCAKVMHRPASSINIMNGFRIGKGAASPLLTDRSKNAPTKLSRTHGFTEDDMQDLVSYQPMKFGGSSNSRYTVQPNTLHIPAAANYRTTLNTMLAPPIARDPSPVLVGTIPIPPRSLRSLNPKNLSKEKLCSLDIGEETTQAIPQDTDRTSPNNISKADSPTHITCVGYQDILRDLGKKQTEEYERKIALSIQILERNIINFGGKVAAIKQEALKATTLEKEIAKAAAKLAEKVPSNFIHAEFLLSSEHATDPNKEEPIEQRQRASSQNRFTLKDKIKSSKGFTDLLAQKRVEKGAAPPHLARSATRQTPLPHAISLPKTPVHEPALPHKPQHPSQGRMSQLHIPMITSLKNILTPTLKRAEESMKRSQYCLGTLTPKRSNNGEGEKAAEEAEGALAPPPALLEGERPSLDALLLEEIQKKLKITELEAIGNADQSIKSEKSEQHEIYHVAQIPSAGQLFEKFAKRAWEGNKMKKDKIKRELKKRALKANIKAHNLAVKKAPSQDANRKESSTSQPINMLSESIEFNNVQPFRPES